MIIKPIASSSRGNAYYISNGISHLLIEAGVKLDILRKHDINLVQLDGCLITHEHKDHSKFAKDVARYTRVYASKGTLDTLDFGLNEYKKIVLEKGKPKDIGTFTVVPFEVQHDAAEPLGFLIYSKPTKERLLFATDTYYIKNRFPACEYYMIECNYSSEIVKKNLENGMSEVRVKRLFTSHMSLENCVKFLKAQDLRKCKAIYLMHLSDGNSDAKLFKEEIQKATGKVVYVCPA